MLFSTRAPFTVMRIHTEASPFFSSLAFLMKKSTLNEFRFMFLQFFRWTKVGNHTRFLDTQNIANKREIILFGGDSRSTFLAPPIGTPETVIFCRFLRPSRKQKIPISFGNQDFAVFCFFLKWCHQESNRGHKDFQSFALPTELWHHRYCLFAGAKVGLFCCISKFLL